MQIEVERCSEALNESKVKSVKKSDEDIEKLQRQKSMRHMLGKL